MKIAALVSGGVDSSVALKLVKDAGHDVTAFYIKIWLEDELAHLGKCPWEEDLRYAQAVCDACTVELRVISLQKEYWDRVISYTISELHAGRTPNPDILCNQRIKFGAFYDKIGPEFEKIVTGHYAQVEEQNDVFILKRSPDPIKDQTYFLSYLSQAQLARAIFPIGCYTKKQVRQLARTFNLPTKDRKDSQGLCFLGSIPFPDFVKHHLGEKRGELRDFVTGKKLGEHDGHFLFTIGQRHGIKLSGGPFYVVQKDVAKNIVYIGRKEDLEKLPKENVTEFEVSGMNWIAPHYEHTRKLGVRIRHTGEIMPSEVSWHDENTGTVALSARRDIAPGQFATFYDGETCIGGSIIEKVNKTVEKC